MIKKYPQTPNYIGLNTPLGVEWQAFDIEVEGEIPPEIEAECKVWGGVHPHLEILKYAARKEADTIVMGSHTKDKDGKWYVGSAVERVSYRATCPVIVITDPEVLSKT